MPASDDEPPSVVPVAVPELLLDAELEAYAASDTPDESEWAPELVPVPVSPPSYARWPPQAASPTSNNKELFFIFIVPSLGARPSCTNAACHDRRA
jgi:hypothetical protein